MTGQEPAHIPEQAVAITGMAGRFPGARGIGEFWDNLRSGKECIRFHTTDELRAAGVDEELLSNPDYIPACGELADSDMFDAGFFDYSAREAELMDPQHRLFLECAAEALERANVVPGGQQRVSVLAGVAMNSYLLLNVLAHPDIIANLGIHAVTVNNDKDYIATRVAYKLGLTGPALTVQTSCSTSLVAVHLACRTLLTYEADVALAGGSTVSSPQRQGYVYVKGGIASPDGHCRAFDAKAEGLAPGSGVGVVVLKRLEDALASRDTVHAIILGSAINNDGSAKIGFTAPSVSGQDAVITEALQVARVTADTIGYVEAHGTGTPLGDPVEVTALSRAFRRTTARKGYCALGSVKTNIGHLDAAAGAAGLIKAVLALENQEIPPSLHFRDPNPAIDFDASPFYVNTTATPWPAGQTPRRACVSSFGLGGTNAHVVLEQAPAAPRPPVSRGPHLLLLSGKSASAVDAIAANLAGHLRRHPGLDLADVAYTLRVGRRSYPHRRAIVGSDRDQVIAELARPGQGVPAAPASAAPVYFMFPGFTTVRDHMASGLYERYRTFRDHMDACGEIFRQHIGLDLRDVVGPAGGDTEAAADPAGRPLRSACATFAIEYAMAQLLISWGIRPRAMVGHSMGEYVAACLGGVFTLEDALRMVALRYQLFEQLPPGAMLSVPLPADQARELLNGAGSGTAGGALSIAAVNAPSSVVISGPVPDVSALAATLEAREIHAIRLDAPVAMHSAMLDPILDRFAQGISGIPAKAPELPYVSGVTGSWAAADQVSDPAFWVRQLRDPVLFSDALRTLADDGDGVFLEVGPGRALTSLAKAQRAGQPQHALATLPSSPQPQAAMEHLLGTIAALWQRGVSLSGSGHEGDESRCRIELPTYPFERQSYWLSPRPSPASAGVPGTTAVTAASTSDDTAVGSGPGTGVVPGQWFCVPSWGRAPLPPPGPGLDTEGTWLVFTGKRSLSSALADRLRGAGARVVEVMQGDRLERAEAGWIIDPSQPGHYRELLAAVRGEGRELAGILHAWAAEAADDSRPSIESFEDAQAAGFYSLLFLAQALDASPAPGPVAIWLITAGLHDITGTEELRPQLATVLGPARVIPQELAGTRCRAIDVASPLADERAVSRVAGQVIAELAADSAHPVVAYRGPHRWVQSIEEAPPRGAGDPVARQGAHYLITGGLDGYGGPLAGYLMADRSARVSVIEDVAFPDEAEWDAWLATHPEHDPVSQRIQTARALAGSGLRPHLARADVTSPQGLRSAVAEAISRSGPVAGVIHTAGLREEANRQLIRDVTVADCQRHFRQQAHSTIALAHALEGSSPDFCLIQTTLSPRLGGVGRIASAGASAFAHALAQAIRRTAQVSWIAVCCDDGEYEETATSRSAPIATPFSGENAPAVLDGILSRKDHQDLTVTKSDMHALVSHWTGPATRAAADARAATTHLHPRPALPTPYEPPRNDIEARIVSIWQSLIGIEPIGVHDDFFAVGGHSLLGTQLVARLRDSFHVDFPLRELFEGPTIAELAVRMVQLQAAHSDDADLEAILSELERGGSDITESTQPDGR